MDVDHLYKYMTCSHQDLCAPTGLAAEDIDRSVEAVILDQVFRRRGRTLDPGPIAFTPMDIRLQYYSLRLVENDQLVAAFRRVVARTAPSPSHRLDLTVGPLPTNRIQTLVTLTIVEVT